MARHRMLTPINSIKHYVGISIATLASGVTIEKKIVDAIVAPGNTTSEDVTEGSIVKAVFIEMWVIGAEAAGVNSSFNLVVEKRTNLITNFTITNAANLGAYENKKNILYTTQGITASEQGANAIPVIRSWFKIPKGKQRFGLGDELVLHLSSLAGDFQFCGFFTYKEFR